MTHALVLALIGASGAGASGAGLMTDGAATAKNTPVILLNGLGGAALECQLNRTSAVRAFCSKRHDWYTLWLSVEELLPAERPRATARGADVKPTPVVRPRRRSRHHLAATAMTFILLLLKTLRDPPPSPAKKRAIVWS